MWNSYRKQLLLVALQSVFTRAAAMTGGVGIGPGLVVSSAGLFMLAPPRRYSLDTLLEPLQGRALDTDTCRSRQKLDIRFTHSDALLWPTHLSLVGMKGAIM